MASTARTPRTTSAPRRAAKATAPKATAPKRAATKPTATKRAATKATAPKRAPRVVHAVVEPTTVAPTTTDPTTADSAATRTGPVVAGYRLGLKAMETVTVGVGGFALGSVGTLGLPRKASDSLRRGHATAIHGVTHASDVVGTKAAWVVGRGVAAASGAARFVFP